MSFGSRHQRIWNLESEFQRTDLFIAEVLFTNARVMFTTATFSRQMLHSLDVNLCKATVEIGLRWWVREQWDGDHSQVLRCNCFNLPDLKLRVVSLGFTVSVVGPNIWQLHPKTWKALVGTMLQASCAPDSAEFRTHGLSGVGLGKPSHECEPSL